MMMGTPDPTALLAQRLQQLEENERRKVQQSRIMMLLACILGEAALILSLGAAVWSNKFDVFPASISDMNADNRPNAKIFFGLLVAMGITLLASKYGQRILRVRTLPEIVYLDVVIPIAIVVTACVPEIYIPEEDGGSGEYIMTAVHSGAAAIVCVLSPIIFTIKAIPRLSGQAGSGSQRPRQGCAASLCQSNAVLASYGDVLLSCGGRPLLRYHWGMMVVLQTICVGLFVVFFSYNELYAAYPRQHEHVISFATEFALVTSLFLSFVIITRLGREGGSAARGGTAGRASGDRVAVTVRDSNGGVGGNGGAHDEEVARGVPQLGEAEAGADGARNGHAQPPPQEQPPVTNGSTAFARWVQNFTNRVSIGE